MAAALLGVVAASGCTSSPSTAVGSSISPPATLAVSPPADSPRGTPAASAASSSPDPTAAASQAALDAYLGFRTAQVAAEATADAHNPDLAKYAGDKALADERANLLQMAQAGIVVTGRPVFHPHVASVTLNAAPEVTITDCIDTSAWTPIYKATGKSAAAPGQPRRVMATALARPYGTGWLIMDLTTDRSRSC